MKLTFLRGGSPGLTVVPAHCPQHVTVPAQPRAQHRTVLRFSNEAVVPASARRHASRRQRSPPRYGKKTSAVPGATSPRRACTPGLMSGHEVVRGRGVSWNMAVAPGVAGRADQSGVDSGSISGGSAPDSGGSIRGDSGSILVDPRSIRGPWAFRVDRGASWGRSGVDSWSISMWGLTARSGFLGLGFMGMAPTRGREQEDVGLLGQWELGPRFPMRMAVPGAIAASFGGDL